MGYYLDNTDSCTLFKEVVNDPYFVDKSAILSELIPFIDTQQKYICITRPRRFGKTVMANLVGAFFSKACDTSELFDNLDISKLSEYKKYQNQYHVISIDFSEMDDECKSYYSYIRTIKTLLREDLHMTYPQISFRKNGNIPEDLKRIHLETKDKFIFVFDEWDAIFHAPFLKEKEKQAFLSFLKSVLKGKAYISFVYMTGILPITKYSSGSELNMFAEFNMATSPIFSQYFGFTESEVDTLYDTYKVKCENPEVSRKGLREWYNGYYTARGERLYNPRSVIQALKFNHLENYWTSSGPYDEIFYYIEKNIVDIKEDLALMLSGVPVAAKIQEYAATSMKLYTKDEIFSAMVVYGFLSYTNGFLYIPNKELMDKFRDMVQKEASLGYIYRLSKESERMLKATLAGDTDTMIQILEFAHDTEIPLYSYNNESDLTALVNLVYLSARDSYRIEREDKAGRGYVDFIFYPEINENADSIILELKVDSTPEEAIQQIKDRKYALSLKGKLGERQKYTGRILAVGIAYNKESKQHNCKIEVLK